jgi:hypothetical protein
MPIEDELLERLKDKEDALVERKPTADKDEIRAAVVAFANTVKEPSTGVLFLGVDTRGVPNGKLTNPDEVQRQIRNKYLPRCYPPIEGFQTYALRVGAKHVVAVVVHESRNRPHFTGAAFVRVGSETVPASEAKYQELIEERNDLGSMTDARSGFGLVLLGIGKVLAAGGVSGSGVTVSTAEISDPATGSWSPTGSMHDSVTSAGFAVLSKSSSETTVLRAGGSSVSGTYLSTAEVYSTSAGTWATTGSLHGARAGFGIVKLTSGDIFVAGGTNIGVVLSTAETYSVASGMYLTEPSMHDARSRFRLVLLNNGDALAVGGSIGSTYLSTAEFFAP